LRAPDLRKFEQKWLTVLSHCGFLCNRNIRRRPSAPRAALTRIAGVQTLRNVAIIAALAAVVDFLPGGGAAADTVMAALTLIFLAAIAWFVYRLYREQQLTLATLSDAQKAGVFGAVGGIALLVVAYDEFSSWSGGILLWIALMAGCVGAIFLIWRNATTY
jgi:hypothetical protein